MLEIPDISRAQSKTRAKLGLTIPVPNFVSHDRVHSTTPTPIILLLVIPAEAGMTIDVQRDAMVVTRQPEELRREMKLLQPIRREGG